MITKVKKYMKKHHMVHAGDKVVVGLSGGADSVCLLFLLQRLREEMGFSLEAVHINHKLREEADSEAEFVKELCGKWEIPCKVAEVDVKEYAASRHLCIEEAARALRYQVFEEYEGAKIALAHHENDQAETVLFHLFRGSGIRGLTGMRPVRDCYIRPLLCVNKEEILEFIKENHLKFVTDASNFDTTYARNKIRQDLLPVAEKEVCEGSVAHIAHSAELVREAVDFLDEKLKEEYKLIVQKHNCEYYIEKEKWKDLHPYLKSAIVYETLAQACGKRRDLSNAHVESVLRLLKGQSGKQIILPYGLTAAVDQYGLHIGKESLKEEISIEEFPLSLQGETEIKELREGSLLRKIIRCRIFPYKKEASIPNKTYTKWFDYDKINNCPIVRTRHSGDYFYYSDAHRKKLKDYFVNEKVPVGMRNRILVIADGNHIIWIPGYRISAFYKVTEETKQVLEVTIFGGEKE